MKCLFFSGRISRLALMAALLMLLGSCGATNTDETAPALSFDGLNNVDTTIPTHLLTGTVDLGATIEISVGETPVPETDITAENGHWSAPITLQPGSNLVTVSAFDAVRNQRLFSLLLTYDAVSIESFTTPIPTDSLTIGGLIDPNQTSLTLTVTLPDGSTLNPEAEVNDDTWAAILTGLQEGANELLVSAEIPGITVPDVPLTITFDPLAPAVDFNQKLTKVVVPSQTLNGTFDPVATGVTISPAPIDTVPIGDTTTGLWTATVANLAVGKNPVTATAKANNVTAIARTLLIVNQAPPLVKNVSPAQNAVDIVADTEITVVFDASMDDTTINSSTFTINDGAVTLPEVSYDPDTKTATLKPSASLTSGQIYTVTLTTGVTDATGNQLSQPLSWDFTVQ
jgi:Bacterial Ig-like domain